MIGKTFEKFLYSTKIKSLIILILPFFFLISFISASSLTYTNQGTPTAPLITKSGFEANSNVEISSIPEKIEPKSFWEWLLQLLNIKEEEYRDTYVVNICYTQDKYTIDKQIVEVPTIMRTYYNVDTKEAVEVSVGEEVEYKIIEDKEIARELIKADADSVNPTEFESGDKYCFYDKFTLEDLPLKYGDNSIYVYSNYNGYAPLTNATWEGSGAIHTTLNNTLNLIAYYPFDLDKPTTSYDFSSNNFDATYYNAQLNSTCDGGYGKCAWFDGVGDYIYAPTKAGLNANTPITITGWVKPLFDGNQRIFINGQTALVTGDGYLRVEVNNNKFIFGLGDGTWCLYSYVSDVIPNNTWTHFAGTYDGIQNWTFYVNGVNTSNGSVSSHNLIPAIDLMIGSFKTSSTYWKGHADEIMLYNRSLSKDEIVNIYNNQSGRYLPLGYQSLISIKTNKSETAVNFSIVGFNDVGSYFQSRLRYWNISYGYDNTYDEGSMVNFEKYFRADGNASSTDELNQGVFGGNANATADGYYGNGFGFDGIGDYIDSKYDIPDWAGNVSSGWAVSFWVKNTNTAWKSIMGVSNGTENINYFIIGGGGELYWYTREDGSGTAQYLYTPTSLSDNQWHHIVGIKNYSSGAYAYVLFQDGDIVANGYYQAGNDGPFVFDYNWSFGAINTNGALTGNLNGTLDDIIFFNNSLTYNQVQEIYRKGRVNWQDDGVTWKSFTGTTSTKTFKSTWDNVLAEVALNTGTSKFFSPYLYNATLTTLYMNLNPSIWFNNATSTANGTYEGITEITANFTAITIDDLDTITIYLYNSTGEFNITSYKGNNYYVDYSGLAFDTYYLNASVNDSESLIGWTETRTIILRADITNPTLIVYEPENITYTSTQVRLNGSCYDLNSPTTYYSLDSGVYTLFTFNTTISTSGYEVWHDLSVTCNDTYANEVTINRRFYVGNSMVNQTCPSGYHSDGYYLNGTLRCSIDLDTNATTECPDGYFLSGSGTCIPIGQECPANYTSIGYYSNGTIKCRYLNLTTTTEAPCKLTKKINEGYFPYGKLGCAIEFI